MDALQEIQRLRALEAGQAMPLATVRHVHLSQRPLVVLAYHLAGDLGAPVGFCLGTERSERAVIVIGEPRNRDLRFAALARLGSTVADYCDNYGSVILRPRRTRSGEVVEDPIAEDAPQLVFANSPTANWFCGLLGRALRYLPTTGDRAVEPVIPSLGRDLTFFSDRRAVIGQSVALAATDFAALHWATGQTPSEDQNIHSLAAWIVPERIGTRYALPTDIDVLLHHAENQPAAGPVPEPAWDADVLEPLVAGFNAVFRNGAPAEMAVAELESAIQEALDPVWQATWDLIEELAALPEAAHVQRRWESDRRAWGYHLQRARTQRAWFRRVPTALQAARLLAESESSLARVAREMALDDPLVAARLVVSGEAVRGEVIDLDLTHQEMGPSGRRLVNRPLIRLHCDDPCELTIGTTLHWSERAQLTVRIIRIDDPGLEVSLMTIAGHGNGAVNPALLPRLGSTAVFGPWAVEAFYPPTLPREAPWTHRVDEPLEDGLDQAS